MEKEHKPPLPISEELLEKLKPTLVRLNVLKFKQQVLKNLKPKGREKERREGY